MYTLLEPNESTIYEMPNTLKFNKDKLHYVDPISSHRYLIKGFESNSLNFFQSPARTT